VAKVCKGLLAPWAPSGQCRLASADHTSRLTTVRFVFTTYLLLITVGLAFYIAIGITNHQ
jgi:hypothetical protein